MNQFLEPLKKILESGKSPAEMWKKLFFSEWKNDIDMLYKTNYFKVLEDEKFESLEELRKDIDEIDLKILDLIQKRKDLVTEVVKLKKRDQIVDQKRIEFILNKLRKEALSRGLAVEFIEEIWTLMIKNFIKYEEKIFDEIHKK